MIQPSMSNVPLWPGTAGCNSHAQREPRKAAIGGTRPEAASCCVRLRMPGLLLQTAIWPSERPIPVTWQRACAVFKVWLTGVVGGITAFSLRQEIKQRTVERICRIDVADVRCSRDLMQTSTGDTSDNFVADRRWRDGVLSAGDDQSGFVD